MKKHQSRYLIAPFIGMQTLPQAPKRIYSVLQSVGATSIIRNEEGQSFSFSLKGATHSIEEVRQALAELHPNCEAIEYKTGISKPYRLRRNGVEIRHVSE